MMCEEEGTTLKSGNGKRISRYVRSTLNKEESDISTSRCRFMTTKQKSFQEGEASSELAKQDESFSIYQLRT